MTATALLDKKGQRNKVTWGSYGMFIHEFPLKPPKSFCKALRNFQIFQSSSKYGMSPNFDQNWSNRRKSAFRLGKDNENRISVKT